MDFTDLTIDDPAVIFLSHHPPEDVIEIMSTDGNSKAITKLSIITETPPEAPNAPKKQPSPSSQKEGEGEGEGTASRRLFFKKIYT